MKKAKAAKASEVRVVSNPKARLLDQVREVIRVKHYSIRTEEAYVQWIKRFIFFHGKRHPREMGEAQIDAFLTDLAVQSKVSASTQNLALNALVFLYEEVLHLELGEFSAVQELLGHKDVTTTQICTHVMQNPGLGVRSPLDG